MHLYINYPAIKNMNNRNPKKRSLDELSDVANKKVCVAPSNQWSFVCPGKNCDHDYFTMDLPQIPDHLVNCTSNYVLRIDDLINLGLAYHCQCQTQFRKISLERLARLVVPLTKLRDTIGMDSVKKLFTEQIIYFLLDIEPNPSELLHTILEGPPGVGKSFIIDIIADIYINMGYLTKKTINKVKLTDLKGKFVGHSPALTQKAIDDSLGGILVIDEAYSLSNGNMDKTDNYSKEIIDTINRNMTENAGKFILIIAGYKKDLDASLFALNPGLRSRFRFKITIDSYNAEELMRIFKNKMYVNNWTTGSDVTDVILLDFFTEKYSTFKYYGRDMETLLFHTKVAHTTRVLFDDDVDTGVLSMTDIITGYERFFLHNAIKFDDRLPDSIQRMYL